jgi:dethiobiotin synthetase
MPINGFFITGTDTEIGKTYASVSLIEHLKSDGYRVLGLKPIASGCEIVDGQLRNDDALKLMKAANVSIEFQLVNRYAYEQPVSPHLVAADKNETISAELIKKDLQLAGTLADFCIVEAVGGWKVPLGQPGNNQSFDVEQLALFLDLPVILVVGIKLGCINHALLSIEKIQASGAKLIGWVANCCDPETVRPEDQIESIRVRTNAPLLCTLPFNSTAAEWALPDLIN